MKLAPIWDGFDKIFMMKCKPIMIKILSAYNELYQVGFMTEVFQVIIVYISVAFVTNETYTNHVTESNYNQHQLLILVKTDHTWSNCIIYMLPVV